MEINDQISVPPIALLSGSTEFGPNGAGPNAGQDQLLRGIPATTTHATSNSIAHIDDHGRLSEAKSAYAQSLSSTKTKAPLQQELARCGVHYAKGWTVARLREALVEHRYSDTSCLAHRDTTEGMPRTATAAEPPLPVVANPGQPAPPMVTGGLENIDPRLHPPTVPALASPIVLRETTHQTPFRVHEVTPPPQHQTRKEAVTHLRSKGKGGAQDREEYYPAVPNPLSQHEFEEDIEQHSAAPPPRAVLRNKQLMSELGIDGAHADELIRFDPGIDPDADIEKAVAEGEEIVSGGGDKGVNEDMDGDENDEDEDEDEDNEDGEDDTIGNFDDFKKKTRMDWVKRTEGNRRKGGLRTQRSLLKVWTEFVGFSKDKGQLQDDIVDEHSLLLFMDWNSKRAKRTRRGQEISGTHIGPSQIKKHFFSVLRVRKEQEAADPSLRSRRPAVSVHVWDAVKTAMNESLKRIRSGFVGDNEDAPDIIYNTFLDRTTQEEMTQIGIGFLCHRELRCCVNGHLAWTIQNATGNRGDDVRALRISELQPYVMLHPNNSTDIFTVLAMQGEEKAGVKGMQSRVNPVYSVLMTPRLAERDPLGALMIYFHYIWDVRDITKEVDINWVLNKTWRNIRMLHGKHPESPLGEQSLYNLYVQAMGKAGFNSRIKQHLPRHLMPYKQQELGVPAEETSKMGWKRGQTYYDVYAPALPKKAILAAHGYKVTDSYNPVWRKVEVPERFLQMVCPMAEKIIELVKGRENLRGVTSFWEMIIELRPHLFQSAAAIYRLCPKSPIFRLPALADPEVQNWMKSTYPQQLSLLEEQANTPTVPEHMRETEIGSAMQEMCRWMINTHSELVQLRQAFNRRTSLLSPAQGYSHDTALQRAHAISGFEEYGPFPAHVELERPSTPVREIRVSPEDSRGVYASPGSGFRAFVCDSPKDSSPRPRTQVDLVLPDARAFSRQGYPLTIIPPVLGLRGVTWPAVFKLILQPRFLWEVYKPSKTLDAYATVEAIWALYTVGEAVTDTTGNQNGMKPPLQLLEETFGTEWRKDASARKVWERFREIPEWIVTQSKVRGVTANVVIEELEQMRRNGHMGLNALGKIVKKMRVEQKQLLAQSTPPAQKPSTETHSNGTDDAVETQQKAKRSKSLDARKPSKRVKVQK